MILMGTLVCIRIWYINDMNRAKVVAVSGVSGSGKTSIVKQLSATFSSPALFFDEYTDINTYPKDMKLWFKNGSNVSEIKTPRLINQLNHLIESCTDEFIFIEEPFGKCRDSISPLIDLVVFLDMPMEVCLSRLIMRNINHSEIDSLKSIPKYLAMYDDHFRTIYIESSNQIRERCDLKVTQVESLESTANLISNWLQRIAN